MEIFAYRKRKLFKLIAIYESIKMCPTSLFLSSFLFLLVEKKSHRKAKLLKN